MTPNQHPGSTNPTRVLHVDDESDFLHITAQMLNSFDPYLQIDFVSSPREALEKLEKEDYDCIISDYRMPEMDGIQLAIKIREESNVPFILYTGQGSEEVAEAAFAAGIGDYLRKEIEPAHFQVLARRIRAAVEGYQAESRLHEREQELSSMIENSIDGIFRVEMARGVTRCNPAFLKFFGYSLEELQSMGMRMLELIHDEDKAQFVSELDDLSSRRLEKYSSLNRWYTKSGEVIWLDSNITALVQDEKFIGVEIIARDVTKRMEIDGKLKRSEARFKSVFENMTDGFALHRIVQDKAGNPIDYIFLEVNDPFEVFTGLKRNEIIGKTATEVLPGIENDPADWIGRYGKIALEGTKEQFEQYAEPLARWYSVAAYSPRKGYFVTFIEEITDRKNYEEKLTALHRQAVQLNIAEDFDEVWDSILEAAGTILGFDYFGILVNEDGALREIKSRGLSAIDFTLPLSGKGLTVRAANEKTTIRLNDVRGNPDFVQGSLDTKSEMVVPVVMDDEVYAVLNVESESLNAFSGNDQRLLETLAMHVSSALSRLKSIEALRASEEKYQKLLEQSLEGVAVVAGTEIVYANMAMAELYGVDSPSEMIGEDAMRFVALDDRETIREMALKRQRGETQPDRFVFKGLRVNGSEIDVEAYTSLVDFEGQKASLTINRDITERKQMEEELKASEAKYRSFLEEGLDGVVVTWKGEYLYINQRYAEMLGYSDPSELLGRNTREVIDPRDAERLDAIVERRQSGDMQRLLYEVRSLKKDGSSIWVEVASSGIEFEGNQAVITYARDITERKRMEEERTKNQERIIAIHQHSIALAQVNNLKEIAKRTFDVIEDVMGYKIGSFGQVDERNQRVINVKGFEPDELYPIEGPGIANRAIRTGTTQRIADTRLDEDYISLTDESYPTLSELDVPVKVNGEVVAMINLESEVVDAFTENDQHLVEILAQHVASAISRLSQLDLLRESEEKYRIFLEASMDAIYVVAEEGIIYVNQSGADLLGYSDPSEVMGLDPTDLVPPEQRKELTERLSRTWNGEKDARKFEMQLLRKDGTTIDIETFSCNIVFEGRPAQLAFDRDITERKRMEEELKQNESTLLALHRHARDLAGCLSLEEVYEHTTRIMTETLKFPRVDILMVEGNDLKQVTASGSIPLGVQVPLNGKGVTVKAIREKRSQLINDVSQSEDYIYATGGPQSEPFDGYPLSRAELASPIIVDGEAVGVLNVENTQVGAFTEQNKVFLELLAIHVASAIERLGKTYELERLIEERTTELKEQTLLAQIYLDVAHVIFLVIDPEGEILLLNQKGCDTLGYTQEEAVGLNWIDTFIPRRLREDIIRLHKQGVAGNIELAESHENPVLTRDGEERIIEWHNAYIRDSTGKFVSSISSGIDVTDRRDMQSALAESEQMSAAGKVAAMVGHDLRGPLQTIKNAIFLMEKDPDIAERLRKTISEAVDYAANMLEELRLNIGDASLQLQEVNLGSLIRRAVVEASTPDSVKIELQIADGLDSVHVDPLKIRRVLDNLIRNSVEAMPEGGSLDVSTVCEDHGVLIKVKDSGMGIPEDLRPDLFKAFITTKSKGIGLGLAFCKRAVEAHGGTITMESEVGVGTTFTVRLPVNPVLGTG